MSSSFRHPPFLSVTTPFAAIMAMSRGLGLSYEVLTTMLRAATGKRGKARVFARYEPTEHDVFLTVHSKSGTNWLMQISTQLAWEGQAQFEHIHDLVAWPEAIFPGITPLRDDKLWQAAPTKLRTIKTALETEYVPYSEAATYITILRDPKELFLSGYYFATGLFGMTRHIPMTRWLEAYLSDDYIAGDWAEHTAGYWAWRERPNVLVLHYADLVRDLGQGVRRCAEVMRLSPSQEVLAQVEERACFAYMKARGEAFNPPRFRFVRDEDRSEMLRGGATRQVREVLTTEQRARIDRHFMTKLDALGCDLPYAELYCQGHA